MGERFSLLRFRNRPPQKEPIRPPGQAESEGIEKTDLGQYVRPKKPSCYWDDGWITGSNWQNNGPRAMSLLEEYEYKKEIIRRWVDHLPTVTKEAKKPSSERC